jgi:hypothetical protein
MFRPHAQINKAFMVILVLFMLGAMHVAGPLKIMTDTFVSFTNQPAAFFANEVDPINLRVSLRSVSWLVMA